MGEINVVPYIDVMLVLLIIFMITAPLLTQGIKVELPKAAARAAAARSKLEPLVLSIDRQGRCISMSAARPTRRSTKRCSRRARPLPCSALRNAQVLVKADERIAYGRVVEAMVILQHAGAKKVGFITEPPPEPQRPG